MHAAPKSPAAKLRALRLRLARAYVSRRLVKEPRSIISDDCWGGRVYEANSLPCHSPFVGMGFATREYIHFLERMREPGALDPISISSEKKGYPVIQTRHAELYGMHYKTEQEFMQRYQRRRLRLNLARPWIKIDFGRPDYRPEDIERWNTLRLPDSVAFHPDEPRFHALKIHHGVAVRNWILNGYEMYARSLGAFDIYTWLATGKISHGPLYRLANRCLLARGYLPLNLK
jgi:uncharacterized protein (DUF1919 family)